MPLPMKYKKKTGFTCEHFANSEVFKALNKTRGLYLRWQEISKAPVAPNSPEVEWTSTELRNSLRSIEWDLEDLEDTINILFKVERENFVYFNSCWIKKVFVYI